MGDAEFSHCKLQVKRTKVHYPYVVIILFIYLFYTVTHSMTFNIDTMVVDIK